MRIAAIGRSELMYNSIKLLHANGFKICLIATAAAAPESAVSETDFAQLALELDCPFFSQKEGHQGLDAALQALDGVDIAVSTNWPRILSRETIALCGAGILNVHLGDLPRFRGNATPNWAILAGEPEITLCAHFMESDEVDVGAVIAEARMPLADDTTVRDIYSWAEPAVPQLFLEAVSRVQSDPGVCLWKATLDDLEGFRCYPRTPDDSYIDWSDSAEAILRLVRASTLPFPGAYTYIMEQDRLKRLYIYEARIHQPTTRDMATPGRIMRNDTETGESYVMCGEGVLAISHCKIDDGPYIQPGRYFKSIRMKLGVRLEDYLWISLNK